MHEIFRCSMLNVPCIVYFVHVHIRVSCLFIFVLMFIWKWKMKKEMERMNKTHMDATDILVFVLYIHSWFHFHLFRFFILFTLSIKPPLYMSVWKRAMLCSKLPHHTWLIGVILWWWTWRVNIFIIFWPTDSSYLVTSNN